MEAWEAGIVSLLVYHCVTDQFINNRLFLRKKVMVCIVRANLYDMVGLRNGQLLR